MSLFVRVVSSVVIIALMGGMMVVTVSQAVSAEENEATVCATELEIAVPSAREKGKVPVLLVHGYRGDSGTWSGKGSMKDALGSVDGVVTVTPFDYEVENTEWVAHSGAANRLAKTIVCYNQLYGKKVVVVAHSMGGLLAAEAFDWAAFGVFVKDAGGHLITIGSPYQGSWIAAGLYAGDMSFCGVLTGGNVDLCRDAYSGQATSGLSINSDQLAALPELPEGITHKAIAGRAKYEVCFWGCAEFDMGDLVVPVDSATARSTETGAGDGVTVFDCWISEGWCSHGAMLQAEPVQQEVRKSIEAYLASQPEMTDFSGLQLPIDGDDWMIVTPETSQANWVYTDDARAIIVSRECVEDDQSGLGAMSPAYCPGFSIVDMNSFDGLLPYGVESDECRGTTLHDDIAYTSPRETEGLMIDGVQAIRRTHWLCYPDDGEFYRLVPPSENPGRVVHSWLIPTKGILIFEFPESDHKLLSGLEELLAGASWS